MGIAVVIFSPGGSLSPTIALNLIGRQDEQGMAARPQEINQGVVVCFYSHKTVCSVLVDLSQMFSQTQKADLSMRNLKLAQAGAQIV